MSKSVWIALDQTLKIQYWLLQSALILSCLFYPKISCVIVDPPSEDTNISPTLYQRLVLAKASCKCSEFLDPYSIPALSDQSAELGAPSATVPHISCAPVQLASPAGVLLSYGASHTSAE